MTSAKRYEARLNAGEVVLTYNPAEMPNKTVTWKQHLAVKVQHVDCEPLTEKFKYMFQKTLNKSEGGYYLQISFE